MKLFGMIIPLSLILIRYAARFIFGKQLEMYLDYQWTQFKLNYNKSYESYEKELLHYDTFCATWYKIEMHNKKYEAGFVKWKEGINEFSDLSEQELKNSGILNPKYLTNYKALSTYFGEFHVKNGNPPDSIDWRELGVITPVRRQGKCGCCWAMAAAAAVESHYAIKNKELIHLSVQELIDCNRDDLNRGCRGGIPMRAFKYMMEHGLDTEESYPYEEKNLTCRKTSKSKLKVLGFNEVRLGGINIKDAVGTVGPVTVYLKMTPLMKYTNGIYKCVEEMGEINHTALLIGYGVEDGVPYWLIKNAWGEKWGENGYFRITRRLDDEELEDDCGIYYYIHYPNVAIIEGNEENEEKL